MIYPSTIARSSQHLQVDWWCLGILTFELCSGHPPFESATPMQIYSKVPVPSTVHRRWALNGFNGGSPGDGGNLVGTRCRRASRRWSSPRSWRETSRPWSRASATPRPATRNSLSKPRTSELSKLTSELHSELTEILNLKSGWKPVVNCSEKPVAEVNGFRWRKVALRISRIRQKKRFENRLKTGLKLFESGILCMIHWIHFRSYHFITVFHGFFTVWILMKCVL